jgi:hypothetical protein
MVDFSPLRYLANDPNKPYDPLGAMNPITSGLAKLAYRGFMAPGQALQSTIPMTSEQMIAPAQDMMALMGTGPLAAERGAVGAFGGRLASTTGDELVSNLARAPGAAANEVTPFVRESPGSYQGAARQQQLLRATDKDTHVGDFNYWKDLATRENIVPGEGTRPNANAAARKYSEGGKTTMLIDSNGRRVVYHDGNRIVGERSMDMPRETYPALKNLPKVPYTGQKLGEIVNPPIKPIE